MPTQAIGRSRSKTATKSPGTSRPPLPANGSRAAGPALATKPSDHIHEPILPPLHLVKWIHANIDQLRPPVSNKQLFPNAYDMVSFVSGGPNTRNDYHVNPTEELFYQLKGDIAIRVRPLDGASPHDVIVREGELFLLPRWVPHRPQRPAGTFGLIVEFPRPKGQLDGLRWYCPACDELVHEVNWRLKKIDLDLKVIMEAFWSGPKAARTCAKCHTVIQTAGTIELTRGKVRSVKSTPGSPSRTSPTAAKKTTRAK